MTKPTEQQIQDYDRVQQELNGLQAQLGEVVTNLRNKMVELLDLERDLSPSTVQKKLIGIAASNRANWSGGQTSVSNLIEAIVREEALHYLHYRLGHLR